MTRAPRWTRDRPSYIPPLDPTWDVKLRYSLSFCFTLGMLAVGLALSPVVGPVVRWWQTRKEGS